MNDKKNKISKLALSKSRELQSLIDTLNNTTIGSIVDDIIALSSQATQTNNAIDDLLVRVGNIEDTITVINTKLNSLDAFFSHEHTYEDSTINDTDDGSGILSSTTKATQGII